MSKRFNDGEKYLAIDGNKYVWHEGCENMMPADDREIKFDKPARISIKEALNIKNDKRTKNQIRFDNEFLPKLKSNYDVELIDNVRWDILTENWGVVSYFISPCSLYINDKNKWIGAGVDWIERNLINTLTNRIEPDILKHPPKIKNTENSIIPSIKKDFKVNYSNKLKHPLWQRKRLEIMQRDDFKCKICGDTETTLNVHHTKYINGSDPWEINNDYLVTVCEHCHKEIEELKKTIPDFQISDLKVIKASGIKRRLMILFCRKGMVLIEYDENNNAISCIGLKEEIINDIYNNLTLNGFNSTPLK